MKLLKDAQADMKTLALDMKKNKAEATKILAKLSPEQCQLESFLKTKSVKALPEVVTTKLKATSESIKSAIEQCKLVLGRGGGPPSLTSADAVQLAKQANLQISFVNQLLLNTSVSQMP